MTTTPFRPMRRKVQQMDTASAEAILRTSTSGVLSLIGDGGYPYGVPLSYVYHDGHIYSHSAIEGHKVDAIRSNDRASFTVIGRDEVLPQLYTSNYASVTTRVMRLGWLARWPMGLPVPSCSAWIFSIFLVRRASRQ